eukprot:TRINITY_DN4707_c0_g1_i3.p1 TRINITY_DN4707_c0_g1~~TRINITY_DN4707_c0_g1_i3.p1  ORF type:complete len:225 (+),score=64.32 TRINITY_DN4707_c0_g1_i3:40-675(+)
MSSPSLSSVVSKTTQSRSDGRSAHQLRALATESRALNRADGSARFAFGKSSALAGVHGPVACAQRRDELPTEARLDVRWTPANGRADGGLYAAETARFVRGVSAHVARLDEHPRARIMVTVQSLCADGGSLATACNAATLALLDAGVPLRSLCAAVTCAVTSDGAVQLDPTADEEASAAALLTFAYDATLRDIVAVHTPVSYTHLTLPRIA